MNPVRIDVNIPKEELDGVKNDIYDAMNKRRPNFVRYSGGIISVQDLAAATDIKGGLTLVYFPSQFNATHRFPGFPIGKSSH